MNKYYLEIPLETNIPVLTKEEDNILRCSQIVAHWKRNIYRMILNTYLENNDKIRINVFEKIFEMLDETINGQYSISIDLQKFKKIDFELKGKYNKYPPDFRLKSTKFFYYKFKLYFFLQKDITLRSKEEKINKNIIEVTEILRKFYIYSFLYTLLVSGIGQISSKGLGHLSLIEGDINLYDITINIQDSFDFMEIITNLYIKCCELILEIFKLLEEDNYKVPDIFVSSFKQEKDKCKPFGYIRPTNYIEFKDTLYQEKINFYKNYINAMLDSKLKKNWKLLRGYNIRVNGKYFHTWILGLPRKSRIKGREFGYFTNNCELKMISQIKYVPLGSSCSDFDLILIYYPHSLKIINSIYESGYITNGFKPRTIPLNKIQKIEGLYKVMNCSIVDKNYAKLTFKVAKEFIFSIFKTYFEEGGV